MQVGTKVRYGIRAMLEIALVSDNDGIFQKDIAVKQNLSVKYLDPIISALKAAGLIVAVKGRKSGYKLAREASTISTYDIYLAFRPEIHLIDCLHKNGDCDKKETCAVVDFWGTLNTQITTYFKSVSLADLVNKKNTILENFSTKED